MTPKELKKLADACRKAGILTYKDANIEFTLSPEAPVSNYKKQKGIPAYQESPILTDSLSEESLLFWSSGVTDEVNGESK